MSAFGDNRVQRLPWDMPPDPPYHLHLVEVRQTPPLEEEGPPPFLVTYFHPIALMITFMGVGLQVPFGVFGPQAPLDPIVHFVVPMTTGPILFGYLFESYLMSALPTAVAIITVGVFVEVGWEVIEFTGDNLFGLHWQIDNADTMGDLIIGVVGAAFGAGTSAAVRAIT